MQTALGAARTNKSVCPYGARAIANGRKSRRNDRRAIRYGILRPKQSSKLLYIW